VQFLTFERGKRSLDSMESAVFLVDILLCVSSYEMGITLSESIHVPNQEGTSRATRPNCSDPRHGTLLAHVDWRGALCGRKANTVRNF